MIDGLPRGYDLDKNNKIRKEIICGDEWRIYLTNRETYALLVSPELFQTWVNYINGDIFQPIEEYSLYVSSTQEYIISSLRSGPYPDQVNQVQAFSAAYGQFMIHYPGVYFSDAIYIEELSLLLPLKESETAEDMAICYGMWLTGGVAIPGDNVKRLSSFMTWMPSKSLNKCLELAGIDNQLNEEQESEILVKKDEGNKDGKGSFHLVGRPDLETFFKDKIIDIIEHEDEYTRMGISFPGATILYGPPGCGKTYAVERLSEYLKWPKFSIEAGSVASPYIHDTSKKIAEVFENAIHMAPSILIIDEMEAFLSDRGAVSAGNHHIEEVAEFLRRIPEAIEHHVLIFGLSVKTPL